MSTDLSGHKHFSVNIVDQKIWGIYYTITSPVESVLFAVRTHVLVHYKMILTYLHIYRINDFDIHKNRVIS